MNRIWKRLIGRGLVEPVDDMDAEPWNPELLDWLAADFVEHGYDLKHLIERIMTSRAYQVPAVRSRSEGRERLRLPRSRCAAPYGGAVLRCDQLHHRRVARWWRPQSQRRRPRSREWRFASSRLSRGLGRPIRDQVFTERTNDATTLQALELVNGETLDAIPAARRPADARRASAGARRICSTAAR